MIFEMLGMLNGYTQARRRNIAKWKEEEYEYWERWAKRWKSIPPPPLDSSWWDEAIREDPNRTTQYDLNHFLRCKSAYMDAHENLTERQSSRRHSIWTSNKPPSADDLMR